MNWEKRFWSKVNKNGSIPVDRPELGPCWEWSASIWHGYGRFKFQGRMWSAHRFIYEKMVALIPPGKQCDHLCRNRKCVNYENHIEIVTPRINVLRGLGIAAFEAFQTSCKRGHLFTKENTYWSTRDDRRKRVCRTCFLERSAFYYRKRTNGKVARRASKRIVYSQAEGGRPSL